jgi:hypothetical protein
MKSYKDSIDNLKEEIKLLNKHLLLIKKYPPENIYLMDKYHLVMPRQYRLRCESWRNKIIFNIIASDIWEVPERYNMLLGQLLAPNKTSLIPVAIKDLPLYVHFKYKTNIFERIIKSGRLSRR